MVASHSSSKLAPGHHLHDTSSPIMRLLVIHCYSTSSSSETLHKINIDKKKSIYIFFILFFCMCVSENHSSSHMDEYGGDDGAYGE